MASRWLNEERSWRGRWWLPSDIDNTQPGILTYSPATGLELILIGGFDDTVREELAPGLYAVKLGGGGEWPLLHGSSSGKPITLIDCRVTHSASNASNGFDEPSEQTVIAQQAIIGARLAEPRDHAFVSAYCLIEDSLAWSGTTAISGERTFESGRGGVGGRIELSNVGPLQAVVDGLTIELSHSTVLPHVDRKRRGMTALVRDAVVFGFTPAKPFSLADALEAMRSVQNLIALASSRAPAFLWLTARLPRTEPGADGRIADIYVMARGSGDPEAAARSEQEFVFTLDDIRFGELLPRWMEVQGKFLASCNIILGSRFNNEVHLETAIINSVTAAEAMHKELHEPWPTPKNELEKLIELAADAMPDDRKDWIRRVIPRGHSLRQRLDSLADRVPDLARARLLPNPRAWAKAAVAARNGLSHSGRSTAEVKDLHAVVRVTHAVVIVNLLFELGISEERIVKALKDNRELSYACRLSASHFAAGSDQAATTNAE